MFCNATSENIKVGGGIFKRPLKNRNKMSVQKINIVLFGPGKVGSLFVSQILNNQSLLLEEEKDVRISLVVSSSLVFIENNKNAWDVTFIKSSKNERIANIVAYIQENNFENTIVVDATNSSDLISEYAYFIQNGLNVITLNKNSNLLLPRQVDEIRISSEVYEKKLFKLETTSITKEQASEIAFQHMLNLIKNFPINKAIKKAIKKAV